MPPALGSAPRRAAQQLRAVLTQFPAPRLVSRRHLAAAAALLILVQWGVAHVTVAIRAAGTLTPVFGDGPYQLFNPLRRIAAGQRGGVDFQFFHGLGVPYLHYPVFALAGGDFHASELSRNAVSMALYPLGFLAVFAAATRRFATTVGLTAAALILTAPLGFDALDLPGNSILGVRAACPFLVFAVLIAGLSPRREAIIAGALCGAGFVFGTEHGIASGAMLATVWFARRLGGHPGAGWSSLPLAAAAFAGVAGGLLLTIAGPTGATAALRFGLLEVPADQFWYFGGTTPLFYLGTVAEACQDARLVWHLAAAAGLLAVLATVARRTPEAPVLAGGLAYGLVASVGYLAATFPHYLAPLARIELVAALILARRAGLYLAALPEIGPTVVRVGGVLVGGCLAAGVLTGPTRAAPSSAVALPSELRTVRKLWAEFPTPHPQAAAKTREHLDAVTRAIDADRSATGVTRPPVIWSTYAGPVEAHYGVFHPDTDYIIHALGPARRAGYLAAFRAAEPDYVCTFRRSFFPPFEEWLQQTTWPFYEEVALNYEVLTRTWAGVVWRRRPGPWRTSTTAAELSYPPSQLDGFPVRRPPGAAETDPLVVELTYETEAPLARVPIVGKLPRYHLAWADAAEAIHITLPPSNQYGGTASVVVQGVPGKEPSGWVTTRSPTGGRIRIVNVRVRALPSDVAAAVAAGFLDP